MIRAAGLLLILIGALFSNQGRADLLLPFEKPVYEYELGHYKLTIPAGMTPCQEIPEGPSHFYFVLLIEWKQMPVSSGVSYEQGNSSILAGAGATTTR